MEGSLRGVMVALLLVLCETTAAEEQYNSNSTVLQRRRVRCRLSEFPACFQVSLSCPLTCPTTCLIDCTLCRPVCRCSRPGAVCQDPRFVGGDGITFYFHGRRDRDFCLLTDPDLHINAHFIGKRNPKMKRDFTWVQSIAILFSTHTLLVGAKHTTFWDDASDRLDLSFDGHPVPLPTLEGATWRTSSPAGGSVSITRTRAANGVTVEAEGRFAISAEVVPVTAEESRVHGYNVTAGEDCFAHLDLGFKFYGLSEGVDGVLGQTYRANYTSRAKVGVTMPVLGGDREFSSSGLFATDCAASRFVGVTSDGFNGKELAGLMCQGGADGRGVLCKS